jgi:hypothetical protein
MGQMITKPDTNPIVIAVAAWFIPGLGYYLLGQQKKAMYTFGIAIGLVILSSVTCGLASPLLFGLLAFVYDGYLLGTKLQSGQSIGENENGLEFLNSIFKD